MIQINTTHPYSGYLDSQIGGRSENQDSCGYADTPLGLLVVVCDGMGGGPGGATASSLAVQIIVDCVSSALPDDFRENVLRRAVEKAHEVLLMKQTEVPSLRGMGTTVVAFLINDYSALVAHVGDSRLYQFRRGSMLFRTADHSMVAELVRNGTLTEEQARLSSQSNVITRALGHGKSCVVDINELPYEAKDRFMLCTDGVWGTMPEKQLIKLTAKTAFLSGVVESTVIQVNENGKNAGGHHDNLTMVILETRKNSKLKQKMSTKVRNLLLVLTALCCISLLVNIVMYAQLNAKPKTPEQQKIEKIVQNAVQEKEKELEKKFKEVADSLNKEMKETNANLHNLLDKVSMESEEEKEETPKVSSDETVELLKKLDEIISRLEKLRDMNSGNAKKQQVTSLTEDIKKVKEDLLKASIPEGKLTGSKGVITLLGQEIATRGPKKQGNKPGCVGHYNSIIETVKSIKEQIKK